MIYDGVIEGRYVDLRSAKEEDAEFTLNLRQDPKVRNFFPHLNQTIDKQIEWLRMQMNKENDYFFVVRRKNGERIGTIGVYNIVSGKEAETGRVNMRGNAIESLETNLLLNKFCFDELNVASVYGYVYTDNYRSIRYTERFGGEFVNKCIGKDGREMYYSVTTKKSFQESSRRIEKFLYR